MRHFKTVSGASKLLFLFCLISSLFVGLVPFVAAQTVIIDEQMDGNGTFHPIGARFNSGVSTAGVYGGLSTVFTGSGVAVSEVQFSLQRSGSTVGDVGFKAYIYPGVAGQGYPSGSVLAVSTSTVLFNSISSSGFETVSFLFDGSFTPLVGGVYCVAIQCLDDGLSAAYNTAPFLMVQRTVITRGIGTYQGSSWFGNNGVGLWFRVLNVAGGPVFGVSYGANFPVNDGVSGGVPVDDGEYAAGEIVTVLANTGDLAVEGYKFLGWAYDNNSVVPDFVVNGDVVTPDNFTMPADDVILYAIWSEDTIQPPTPPPPEPPISTDITTLQYIAVFALAIFLTALSVYRQTIIPTGLAAILWFTMALLNYILFPTTISASVSFIYLMLGLVFAGKVINDAFANHSSNKAAQWRINAI